MHARAHTYTRCSQEEPRATASSVHLSAPVSLPLLDEHVSGIIHCEGSGPSLLLLSLLLLGMRSSPPPNNFYIHASAVS